MAQETIDRIKKDIAAQIATGRDPISLSQADALALVAAMDTELRKQMGALADELDNESGAFMRFRESQALHYAAGKIRAALNRTAKDTEQKEQDDEDQ